MSNDPEDWATVPSQSAWLIEYLGETPRYFAWHSLTTDPNQAIRFSRRDDAWGMCKFIRLDESRAKPVEHIWLGDARHRDSDCTASAAANGDLPVPQDCQARAESIAQKAVPNA